MHSQTTPRALLLALTILLLAALATPSCALLSKTPPAPAPSGGAKKAVPASNTATSVVEPVEVQLVDSAGLKDLGSQDALIVDIRAKDEFDLEHLPDAKNVPMAKFTDTAKKWATDEPVVVYGSGDAKSQTAAAWLVRNGFEQVYRLDGGIEAYDGNREGPLGKYRLERPMVLYVYSESCGFCTQATPRIDEFEKKYGKKVDFERVNSTDFKPINPSDFNQVVYISSVPTFVMIESDPRTYRKAVGLGGLQVLNAWLQEQ